MERWAGRVAFVTGASSGIGAAICRRLVKEGMKVVGVARRVDRVQAIAEELEGSRGKLHPLQVDVSKEEDILAAFQWARDNLGGVDVLVNNAGVGAPNTVLTDGDTSAWRKLLDVNVLGLSICTREAVRLMREKNVDDGHIIHISSLAAHRIVNLPMIHFYTGTKHAVKAMTEGLRQELVDANTNIRVSSISPGLVATEIVPKDYLTQYPYLEADDIAEATVYILGAPPHVQIHDIVIRPTRSIH